MRRIKSTTRREYMLAASSSSSDDDLSLGAEKSKNKYAKENALPRWNDVAVWRDSKMPYIPEDIWA